MDTEKILNWAGAIIGAMFTIIAGLFALAYRDLRREDQRNAKNTHDLRNQIQQNLEPRLDAVERGQAQHSQRLDRVEKDIGDHEHGIRGWLHRLSGEITPVVVWFQSRGRKKDDEK